MKPITEQEKQELIEHCKRVMRESSPDGLEYPMAEITLASLTAKSKVTLFSDERDCDQYSFEVNERIPDGIHELYTASPVPVIKFPDHEMRELVNEITVLAKKYADAQCLRDAISRVVADRLNGWGK